MGRGATTGLSAQVMVFVLTTSLQSERVWALVFGVRQARRLGWKEWASPALR
jgi:hypothetical protein